MKSAASNFENDFWNYNEKILKFYEIVVIEFTDNLLKIFQMLKWL